MKVYLLMVGGSGIRVARSLMHLCAAGCFPKKDCSLKMMLIDTDHDNGDTKILKDTINAYNAVTNSFGNFDNNEFPELEYYEDEKDAIDIWNPLAVVGSSKDSMSKIINVGSWSVEDENEKNLRDFYDFLYTKGEQEIPLDKGFYGHTSIGSYFMTNAIMGENGLNDEWNKFFSDIDEEDHIFVIGSMFGGTGASAIPTIAKILKNVEKTKDNKCSCAIVMPYYKTVADGTDVGKINSSVFPAKNRAALYHYADQQIYRDFDHIYFIGEDKEKYMNLENNNGGEEQRNKANYIEIETALTICDLVADIKEHKTGLIKTYDVDVPGQLNRNVGLLNNINKGKNLATRLVLFLEIAMLYNKGLYYILQDDKKRMAWKSKFTVKPSDMVGKFKTYCSLYVNWFYEIIVDTNAKGQYSTPAQALENGGNLILGDFRIINMGADKLKLFNDLRYEYKHGFFVDEYKDFNVLGDLNYDPFISDLTGGDIIRRFDENVDRGKKNINNMGDLVTELKKVILKEGCEA